MLITCKNMYSSFIKYLVLTFSKSSTGSFIDIIFIASTYPFLAPLLLPLDHLSDAFKTCQTMSFIPLLKNRQKIKAKVSSVAYKALPSEHHYPPSYPWAFWHHLLLLLLSFAHYLPSKWSFLFFLEHAGHVCYNPYAFALPWQLLCLNDNPLRSISCEFLTYSQSLLKSSILNKTPLTLLKIITSLVYTPLTFSISFVLFWWFSIIYITFSKTRQFNYYVYYEFCLARINCHGGRALSKFAHWFSSSTEKRDWHIVAIQQIYVE